MRSPPMFQVPTGQANHGSWTDGVSITVIHGNPPWSELGGFPRSDSTPTSTTCNFPSCPPASPASCRALQFRTTFVLAGWQRQRRTTWRRVLFWHSEPQPAGETNAKAHKSSNCRPKASENEPFSSTHGPPRAVVAVSAFQFLLQRVSIVLQRTGVDPAGSRSTELQASLSRKATRAECPHDTMTLFPRPLFLHHRLLPRVSLSHRRLACDDGLFSCSCLFFVWERGALPYLLLDQCGKQMWLVPGVASGHCSTLCRRLPSCRSLTSSPEYPE